MLQFYVTSHGQVHVADNPVEMGCGTKLKIPATPLGTRVDTANDSWHVLVRNGKRFYRCDRCIFHSRSRGEGPEVEAVQPKPPKNFYRIRGAK